MKKTIILLSISILFGQIIFSQCINGDAELNNFNGWGGSSGPRDNNGVNLNNQVNGINNLYHNITNVGFDPIVGGNILPTVTQGLHSFKIGNSNSADVHGDRMWYTFTVTTLNYNFGFKYAVVLQDGSHTGNQNPFFN